MKRLLIATTCVAVVAACPAAQAQRPATSSERRAITRAFVQYVRENEPVIGRIRVVTARISTVNADFAASAARLWNKKGIEVAAVGVVLVHGRSGRWYVIGSGSDLYACEVPPPVRRDLGVSCR